jgi:hypothetical protein
MHEIDVLHGDHAKASPNGWHHTALWTADTP